MTYRQLLDFLRTNSAHCRSCADTASDAEAAEALHQVAEDLERAILALEDAEAALGRPAEASAL